ncbi:hypothetical protein GSK84_30265, partial [Pseudomonas aeruginosa]|nr:hypothetical protein [Pseudomonas aeruginosa]
RWRPRRRADPPPGSFFCIVTACHSGLGGTGDVAILSASNRMGLMPFAQISTRIGGAAMIVCATLLLKVLH